jgi:MFS superfamily sulfate permease-like transporter
MLSLSCSDSRQTLIATSTVTSQAALTLGGSQFTCALGSMLAEVLPFLRDIASGIQDKLGPSHPGVLPTTMAAYAMTSLLLGVVFAALGMLRCGSLVRYFPETVMTGVIGERDTGEHCRTR